MKELIRLNRTVVSPLVAFPVLWVSAVLLSQVHLLSAQTPWTSTVWLVAICVPMAFAAGGLVGSGIGLLGRFNFGGALRAPSERAVRVALLVLLAVGYLELAHQFVKIGGVPLIAPDGNTIRFNQGGPTVVLINLLTVAGLLAFVRPRKLLARESRFELFAAAAAMGGFALQSSRGSLALMIVVAVVARWLYWGRPKPWPVFISGVAGFLVVSFGFYLRLRQSPSQAFEAELLGEVLPDMPFFITPLVPVYLAIVTNFDALQGIVREFPNYSSFGLGAYNSIGLDLFIPGALNVSTVSGAITPPWVTSTVAGALWADGGYLVVIVGVALTGVLSVAAFTLARRTASLGWCLVAGYLFYVTMFGLYTNLWTQQVDWLMVAPMLFILGNFCDRRRPGATRLEIESSTIAAVSENAPEDDNLTGPERKPTGKTWIATGLVAILVLMVSGAILQGMLPEPLAPAGYEALPQSVRTPSDVMTDGDGSAENGDLYWVSGRNQSNLLLHKRAPLARGEGSTLRRLPIGSSSDSRFDIARWRGNSLAVFAMEQRRRSLDMTVVPVRPRDGHVEKFKIPVPQAPEGQLNDYALATWQGRIPDLFVITRGSSEARIQLRILSGESGFTRFLLKTRLPFTGLDPEEWSLDVGTVSSEMGKQMRTVPDLLLARHDRDKRWADIQLVMGERDFMSIDYRRDIHISGDTGLETRFLMSANRGVPSLNVVALGDAGKFDVTVFDLGRLAAIP